MVGKLNVMTHKEENELIAIFDGKVKDEDSPWWRGFSFIIHSETSCHEEQLKYHSSYDWLMPVVEKMEKMGYNFTSDPWTLELIEYITGDECIILKHEIDNEQTKLWNLREAVIEFIKLDNALKLKS